jgi:bisphosphoglycerate-independent phosphoglycerate mutase (AlkP superfamily)
MREAYQANYERHLLGFEKKDLRGKVVPINDEVMPAIINIDENGRPLGIWEGRVEPGNRFVFGLNFRKDRQRQWVWPILDSGFSKFDTSDLKGINVIGMTQYVKEMQEGNFLLSDTIIENNFVEYLNSLGKGVWWAFSREKTPFIYTMRGGLNQPFPNEDASYGSISMPRVRQLVKIKDPQTGEIRETVVYNQIKNKDYWKYPGLSMLWVAKAVAEKLKSSRGDDLGATNLDGMDLNGHVAPKHLDERETLLIEDPDFKELVFSQNEFKEKLASLKEVGIKEIKREEGKDVEIDVLEQAEKNKRVEIIVGDQEIIRALGLEDHFEEEEKAFIAVNFVSNTIRVTKLKPKIGNGWDSGYETLKSLDRGIGIILDALREVDGVAVITADHGSMDDFSKPGHTAGDVPLFAIDFRKGEMQVIPLKPNGSQADAMVTMLALQGIEKPAEMEGESLLPEDYQAIPNRPGVFIIADGYAFGDDPDSKFNLTLQAREKGITPTFKMLFDTLPHSRLISAGREAGLRGGKERKYSKKDLLSREEAISFLEANLMDVQEIELIDLDYETSQRYASLEGLFELRNSPFLNDRYFVVEKEENKIVVKYFDPVQYGSTDYNLWTFGAGRIVDQPIVRLDQAFLDGSIFETPAVQRLVELSKRQGYFEVSGILQEEGVHSSLRHLYHLIRYLKTQGINKFVFNMASDGRDESSGMSLKRIEELEQALKYFGIKNYVINLVGGRENIFDRAQNWNITRGFLNILLYGSRVKPEMFNP